MKIRYSELKKIVVEEMKNLGILPLAEGEDLKSVEDTKAKEIEPGEEDQLEKPLDKLKALKIKEAKILRALGQTRADIKKLAK